MLLAKSALIETHQQLIGVVLSIMQFVHAYRKSPALQRNADGTSAPSTFGLKLASWLDGIVQATAQLTAVIDSLPSQLGGKAGNLAELTAATNNSGEAVQVANAFADRLELAPCAPWHANRAPILAITAVSSALASAFANIAHDVITLADPSIAELGEVVLDADGNVIPGAEDGNIRTRLAAASTLLMATSQAAATLTVAPRSVETYNTQWLATLDTLRLTLATAALGNSLIASLDVHADAMGLNLIAAGHEATDAHAAEQIIDAILAGING
jgi:3-carboxy-cis,cis-muconate cycloisomerase